MSPDEPEFKQTLLDAIAAAPFPVAIGDLGKLPTLGRKLTAKKVHALFVDDVAAGRLFAWGDAKKKAYWYRNPAETARDRVLHLAAREARTAKQLEQQAAAESPSISAKVVKAAFAQLQTEKRLLKLSGVIVDVEHPDPYLEIEITRLLNVFGIERSMDRIRELLEASPPEAKASPVNEVAETMFAALQRTAFSPGATVTFYRLRQEPELAIVPKEVFDQAALLLQQNRRALLSGHGHGASLPLEEQQRLVTDGLGAYYVSIYAR